jgi:hypothetical protein
VALAVVSRPEIPNPALAAPLTKAPATPQTAPASPDDPFASLAAPVDDPHPELTGPAGEAPAFDPAEVLLTVKPQPVMLVPQKAPQKIAAPLDVPIRDEGVLTQVDEGLHLRTQGDMQGALTHFRTALQKHPNHPRLLYHAATVYDLMGLPRKADPLWKQLFTLGEGAGDFYKLAQERIADGPPAGGEPEEEKEGKFTILDLKEEKLATTAQGQKVQFVVKLKKNTDEKVNVGEDMFLAIHFFDTVRGTRIARSQVPQPELRPLEEPVDWADGTESFAFEYWQPDMTPEQFARFGRCEYYGCTLEVVLSGKLQDATATTAELLSYARELPLPAPETQDNILNSTPDISLPPGRQPESSLFPPALVPPAP